MFNDHEMMLSRFYRLHELTLETLSDLWIPLGHLSFCSFPKINGPTVSRKHRFKDHDDPVSGTILEAVWIIFLFASRLFLSRPLFPSIYLSLSLSFRVRGKTL